MYKFDISVFKMIIISFQFYHERLFLIILPSAINKGRCFHICKPKPHSLLKTYFSLKFSSRFQLIRHAKQKLFIISTYLTCHFKKKETQLICKVNMYILTSFSVQTLLQFNFYKRDEIFKYDI